MCKSKASWENQACITLVCVIGGYLLYERLGDVSNNTADLWIATYGTIWQTNGKIRSTVIALLSFLQPWRLLKLLIGGLSHLAYTWDHKRVSETQIALLLAWTGANTVFLAADTELLGPREKRAALAAAVNLTPVILGGRNYLIADAIGPSVLLFIAPLVGETCICRTWIALYELKSRAGSRFV